MGVDPLSQLEMEESDREAAGSPMNIVTIYFKSAVVRGNKDWDRGMIANQTNESITLADNEYGLNQRCYMRGDIARIEYTGHW